MASAAPSWRREVVAATHPTMIDETVLTRTAIDELVVSHHAFDAVANLIPYTTRAGIATLIGDEAFPQLVFAPVLPARARVFKRTLDLVVGSLALVIVAPILLAAMVAIRLEGRGPVIFSQMRPGIHGREFRLLKLRTMRVDNDDSEHRAYVAALIGGSGQRQRGMYKLATDPRVTRVGRVLRRHSIDELPQLLNVVRGEMSLVGPRPSVKAELDHYDALHWRRLLVKPGLTGAWQVAGRCELTYSEMVALDIGYWEHWSFRSELAILLRTLPAVLSARGAG